MKVYFIGAGPGDPELITLKGKKIINSADKIIYAGSLVNPEVISERKESSVVYDSAGMSLNEVISVIKESNSADIIARVHTGDPSIYGAIREQIEILKESTVFNLLFLLSVVWLLSPYIAAHSSPTYNACENKKKTK